MSDENALVKVAPVPPMVLARDLQASTPRSFVHVDRHGQVRSPARFRAIQAASYGFLAAVVGGAVVVYGAMFGVLGAMGALGAGVLLAMGARKGRTLTKAARLLLHDRVEEAQAILEALARKRLASRTRAILEQNLGGCHARRGRYDQALEHQRASIALHARSWRRGPLAIAVEYSELVTLVNLDRVAEARALLDTRNAKIPEGDYLRILHWSASLYVALAEGTHALSADELYDRARVALGITSAASLLGLLAWAHHHSGDLDQAWHLLREAEDRRADVPIAVTLPRLHAWLAAHVDEARAADVDPLEAL